MGVQMNDGLCSRFFVFIIIFLLFFGLSYSEEISAIEFVQDNFRLFSEIPSLQDLWVSIDNTLATINPDDLDFDWEEMNQKAETLLKKSNKLLIHFGEDLKSVDKILSEKELKKLESFLKQLSIYLDVVDRAIMKRVVIINRLYKMTKDPDSYTMKEYLEDIDIYNKLMEEYKKEGAKLNRELEELRFMKIVIK